jgi:hypothetical protein
LTEAIATTLIELAEKAIELEMTPKRLQMSPACGACINSKGSRSKRYGRRAGGHDPAPSWQFVIPHAHARGACWQNCLRRRPAGSEVTGAL